MSKILNTVRIIVLGIAVCFSVSCCGIIIETDKGAFEVSDDTSDIRANHQNPNRMNQQAEDKRTAETMKSLEEQNKAEDAARTKKLNELIEKGKRQGSGLNY